MKTNYYNRGKIIHIPRIMLQNKNKKVLNLSDFFFQTVLTVSLEIIQYSRYADCAGNI